MFERYKPKGILIDANLLLLYLVGTYDQRLIGDGKYNKLSKYTIEDYEILIRLKSLFRRTVTTPHVLTEVSNLVGDMPERLKMQCFDKFCEVLSDFEELAEPSFEAAQRTEFRFLGLTDTVLAKVSEQFLIVSDDGRFIANLNGSGLDALNFNHLRQHLFQ